jgi:hypothetical protein
MIALKSPSLSLLSASLLMGLATILCYGCAADGVRQQSTYVRKIQRTEQLLIAAGDADSLAAAAMLSIGPTFDPAQRLTLSARAVSKAPDRPDLVWLNLRLCTQVDTCNPEPLEARVRALDPDNGAAWFDSIGRAGRRNDVVAVRKDARSLKSAPNMGRPLFDSAREASSSITSQCSTSTPSAMRTTSTAIQFFG